jgi:hypothetical protein
VRPAQREPRRPLHAALLPHRSSAPQADTSAYAAARAAELRAAEAARAELEALSAARLVRGLRFGLAASPPTWRRLRRRFPALATALTAQWLAAPALEDVSGSATEALCRLAPTAADNSVPAHAAVDVCVSRLPIGDEPPATAAAMAAGALPSPGAAPPGSQLARQLAALAGSPPLLSPLGTPDLDAPRPEGGPPEREVASPGPSLDGRSAPSLVPSRATTRAGRRVSLAARMAALDPSRPGTAAEDVAAEAAERRARAASDAALLGRVGESAVAFHATAQELYRQLGLLAQGAALPASKVCDTVHLLAGVHGSHRKALQARQATLAVCLAKLVNSEEQLEAVLFNMEHLSTFMDKSREVRGGWGWEGAGGRGGSLLSRMAGHTGPCAPLAPQR